MKGENWTSYLNTSNFFCVPCHGVHPEMFPSHSILPSRRVGYMYCSTPRNVSFPFHSPLQVTVPMLATCTCSTPRTTLSCGHLCSCWSVRIAMLQQMGMTSTRLFRTSLGPHLLPPSTTLVSAFGYLQSKTFCVKGPMGCLYRFIDTLVQTFH